MTPTPATAAAAGAPPASVIRPVTRIIDGMPASDGAGVLLTRMVGTPALPDVDPFLMLDAFHSDDPRAYIAGFPDHPHRGFETITYMLAGRMRHHDNRGHSGLLEAGGVQWMTAGRGIVHSEMPEQQDGLMSGFQLWLNLPARDKMTEPRYEDIPAGRIPVVATADGATVKVIAGAFGGARGPIATAATALTFLDLALPAATTIAIDVPADLAAFVCVHDGVADLGAPESPRRAQRSQVAVLGAGTTFAARAALAPVRLLLLAGRPLREPVVRWGPFVMNTQREIVQAVEDYQSGRF
jgi:redox-sensitive bicupin YhaK (pirin superfamily)